jgi:hypothetical protein
MQALPAENLFISIGLQTIFCSKLRSLKYFSSFNLYNCSMMMFFLLSRTILLRFTFFTINLRFSLNLKNFPSSDLKFYKCSVFSFSWRKSLISSFFLDWYLFTPGWILSFALECFREWNLWNSLGGFWRNSEKLWGKLETAIKSTCVRVWERDVLLKTLVIQVDYFFWVAFISCWMFSCSSYSLIFKTSSLLSIRMSLDFLFWFSA